MSVKKAAKLRKPPRSRTPTPVNLTGEQFYELERLWFYYGNHGPKTTPANHTFIQGLIERFQDERINYDRDANPTSECEAAVEAILAGRISTEELTDSQKGVRAIQIEQCERRIEKEIEWLIQINHRQQ